MQALLSDQYSKGSITKAGMPTIRKACISLIQSRLVAIIGRRVVSTRWVELLRNLVVGRSHSRDSSHCLISPNEFRSEYMMNWVKLDHVVVATAILGSAPYRFCQSTCCLVSHCHFAISIRMSRSGSVPKSCTLSAWYPYLHFQFVAQLKKDSPEETRERD